MSKKKEAPAVTAAEDLGAVGEGIPQSAMPTAPFDKGANEGATVADGAEILRGAQDDKSLEESDCPSPIPVEYGKKTAVNIIVEPKAYMPEWSGSVLELKSMAGGSIYAERGRVFNTGVFAEIPEGYIGLLLPDKHLNENCGILCQGIVQPGDSGSISVTLYNRSTGICDIQAGQKIARLVVVAAAVLNPEIGGTH